MKLVSTLWDVHVFVDNFEIKCVDDIMTMCGLFVPIFNVISVEIVSWVAFEIIWRILLSRWSCCRANSKHEDRAWTLKWRVPKLVWSSFFVENDLSVGTWDIVLIHLTFEFVILMIIIRIILSRWIWFFCGFREFEIWYDICDDSQCLVGHR